MELNLDEELAERYAFLDPAGGKAKKDLKHGRARSAIVVVGVDWLSRLFVLDAWADACRTETLVERIIMINEQWSPRQFGIEANAMQSLFADTVIEITRLRDKRVPIIPVTQPTKIKKEFRIRTALQVPMATGRLFFHPSQAELMKELRAFPRGSTVDIVDALASAVTMVPNRKPRKVLNAKATRLAKHLRSVGVPARIIEKKVAEILG